MFETFTVHAREAIRSAQREASDMGHGTVEVEHLLLGLFGCDDEIVSRVWADFGLTIQPARELVRKRMGVRPEAVSDERPPFSQAAKEALRSAYRFGLGKPGPEHLLIVLTRRGEGAASEVLTALDADPNQIRFETKKRAFPNQEPGPSLRVVSRSGLLEELDFGDL